MNPDQRPVRTTIVLGAVGALFVMVAGWMTGPYGIGPHMAFGLVWIITAAYAMALARWSDRSLPAVIFPLLVLGAVGMALPRSVTAYGLVPALLSWIRSGICFPRSVLPSILRELVLSGGGALMVAFWAPPNPFAWAMSIWLFGLVQALFFILFEPRPSSPAAPAPDPFDMAQRRIDELLDG